MAGHSSGTGLGLALVSAATFGTSGAFAASLIASGWSPGAAVTVRVLLAAAVLTVPALLSLRGRFSELRRGLSTLTLYGLAGVAGAQLCYFMAVEHLSVAVALLLEYSGVLLVVGWLWLRHGRRPSIVVGAGAALAVVGLALVLNLFGAASLDLVGVLWGLGAAVGLAVYFVLSASQEAPLPPLVVAWGGLTVGGALLLLAGVVGALPLRANRADVTLAHTQVSWVLPVLGLALLAAVVAYVAGIFAARALGATVASFVGLTEVLFAVLFAYLLLGQVLTPGQLLGGLLVVAGIVVVRVDELRRSEPLVPVTPGQDVALHQEH